MHLIIDGYGDDPRLLENKELIYDLLDRYPGEIGMTKIAPPYVFRYVGDKPEDWGVSGFVPIAESHISIHTFVERCLVNIDVFSCKDFDAQQVMQGLKEHLRLHTLKGYLLRRGLEPSGSEEIAVPIAELAFSDRSAL
jgi:S-adenosylmethionine decarboxylase